MQDRTDLVIERPLKQMATMPKMMANSKSKPASVLARTAEPLSMAFQCNKLQTIFLNAAQVHKRPAPEAGQSLLHLQCQLDCDSTSRHAGFLGKTPHVLCWILADFHLPISSESSWRTCWPSTGFLSGRQIFVQTPVDDRSPRKWLQWPVSCLSSACMLGPAL